MIEVIVDKFNEIIFNACVRFGKEEGVEAQEMQVLFSLDDEGGVVYSILKNYREVKKVTFLQILNVKIDFKGYSLFVPSFIQNTLNQFSSEMQCSPRELFVMCVARDDKSIALVLYKGRQMVKQIKLDDLKI